MGEMEKNSWVRKLEEQERRNKKEKRRRERERKKEEKAQEIKRTSENASNASNSVNNWSEAKIFAGTIGLSLALAGVTAASIMVNESGSYSSDSPHIRVEKERNQPEGETEPIVEQNLTMRNGSTTDIRIVSQDVNWRSSPDFNDNVKETIYPGTIVCKIGNETGTDIQGDKIYTFGLYKKLGDGEYIGDDNVELGYIAEYYQAINNPSEKMQLNSLVEPDLYKVTERMEYNSNPFTGAPADVPKNTKCYYLWIDDKYIIAYRNKNYTFDYAWADPNKLIRDNTEDNNQGYNQEEKSDFGKWLFNGGTKIVGAKNVYNSALKGAQKGAQIATAILDNGEEISVTNFREGMKAIITQPADTENKIPQTQEIEERE